MVIQVQTAASVAVKTVLKVVLHQDLVYLVQVAVLVQALTVLRLVVAVQAVVECFLTLVLGLGQAVLVQVVKVIAELQAVPEQLAVAIANGLKAADQAFQPKEDCGK